MEITKNQLNSKITLTHTPTASKLLEIHPDAFCLYNYYCYTASWQDSNPVKATNGFAQKGLGWGKPRLLKAKKILIESGAAEQIYRKDSAGKIIGHYVLVKQIATGNENHRVDLVTTNASQASKETFSPSSLSVLPVKTKKIAAVTVTLSTDPIEAWDEIPDYPNFFDMPAEQKPKSKDEFFAMQKEWSEKTCEQGRSKVSLYPCTYEEIWALAMRLKLDIPDVIAKHRKVIDMINDGNKYKVKTVYRTLLNWLEGDISKKYLEPMDDIQMLSVESEEPVRKRAHRFLVQLRERAKSEGKI
jgi:hypothetical protein